MTAAFNRALVLPFSSSVATACGARQLKIICYLTPHSSFKDLEWGGGGLLLNERSSPIFSSPLALFLPIFCVMPPSTSRTNISL